MTEAPTDPNTLTFDIGGTGLKAMVLGPDGEALSERSRIKTPHPLTPNELVDHLAELVAPLPDFQRISVGFPGVIRHGRLLSAHNFVGKNGPGSDPDPRLVDDWIGFDLQSAIEQRFDRPTILVNDADLQGFDVVSGDGVEVVITLGTGVGSAVFDDGRLAPHLELAHHPFRKGDTYEEQLGDAALEHVGTARWNKRLAKAIKTLDALFTFDHLYLGGGNSRRIEIELPERVEKIDPNAGLLAGIKLWAPGAVPGR